MSLSPIGYFSFESKKLSKLKLDHNFSITFNAQHQLYLNSALHSLFIPLATQTLLDYAISAFRLFSGSEKEEIRKNVSKSQSHTSLRVKLHEATSGAGYSGVCKVSYFLLLLWSFFSETFVSNSFWAAWEDRHEWDNREDFKIPRTVEKSRITHRSEKLRQSVRSVWEYFSLLICFFFLSPHCSDLSMKLYRREQRQPRAVCECGGSSACFELI